MTKGVFATSAEAQAAGLYVRDANGVDRTAFEAGDVHFVDLDGDHFVTEADRMVKATLIRTFTVTSSLPCNTGVFVWTCVSTIL